MQEILRRDLVFKIMAVLLAVMLWFYVTNTQNPTIEKTYPVNITYTGLKDGLLIEGNRPTIVEIKVKGLNSVLRPLALKDFKATVDLSQAKPGEGEFLVNPSLPSGVELAGIKPPRVNLTIDTIKEKQLTVSVKLINSVAQGYTSFEPVLTPSRVLVRGGQQFLNTLESAQVTVDLNNAADNLSLTLPVNLLDKNGNPVDASQAEISPKNIQVFVPIIQNVPVKTVPIKPNLVGKPRDSYQISRVVLEPETIKITGSYENLLKIDQITTQPIDINGISENFITQATLIAPAGVSILYEPKVKVVVQVGEAPASKTFTDIPVVLENQPVKLNAELKNSRVNVTVQGTQQDLASLSSASIRALVDLSGLQPGVYQKEVKVALPNTLRVLKVDPGTIEVTITGG